MYLYRCDICDKEVDIKQMISYDPEFPVIVNKKPFVLSVTVHLPSDGTPNQCREVVQGSTGGLLGVHEFQVFEAGSCTENLALNKPATASSGENASNVTDGDMRTGWKPADAGPHWLIVDLQNEQDVNRIDTCWRRNWKEKVAEYTLSLSSDKANWTKVYTWNHKDAEAVISSMRAKYVRLDMVGSHTVNEIKVYGGASKK